jgi:hypothetical protein
MNVISAKKENISPDSFKQLHHVAFPHFMHWPKNIKPVIQTQPIIIRTNCFKRNKN